MVHDGAVQSFQYLTDAWTHAFPLSGAPLSRSCCFFLFLCFLFSLSLSGERAREREFWATYEPKLYLRGQTLPHESHRLRYRRHLEALSPVLMDAAYAVVRLCLRTDLSQVPVHFCIKAIPRCAGIPLYRTHTCILVHLHIYIYTYIYIYILI